MATWTIYTSGADVTMLQAILNGVAMICTQSAFIWGFALLASFWRLIATSTSGALAAVGGNSGSVLATGSLGAITPLVLAVLLTSSAAQCTVQVESMMSGQVVEVANVPFVIAVVPAAASQLGVNLNTVITTAFSSVNPSYDYISATGNGFLDPMRRMLAARTAILRLGGVDSEIHTVLADCLTVEAGVNYSQLNQLVMNAGNTGATSAQTDPIDGVLGTSIGALLNLAAQNANANVPEMMPTSGQQNTVLSCPDAVAQVEADITTQLTSPEFSRVVQGAVNGMDQPNPAASYDINQFVQEYSALREWSSVTGAIAAGQTQGNTEAINLLFAEEVASGLNCLQAGGLDLANCQAAMVQATEVERNNIQAAANEVPMLKYAGSFGAFLLALIIGLGPIIVMFMMFAGTKLSKCIATVVHIMVWPILVMNVGAELINAMISMQFSNFMATVAQNGYLSQAEMLGIYKELSLQVGVGSHIMASLPVLMSMIFALGETAALVSVANDVAPKGKEVGEAQAPSPSAAAPLLRQTASATAEQGMGFSVLKAAGSIAPVSTTQTFGATARESMRTISDAETRTRTVSAAQTNSRNWQHGFATGHYESLGVTQSEGEAVRNSYDETLRNSHHEGVKTDASGQRTNQNTSNLGVSAGASLSVGKGGGVEGGLNVGGSGSTQTGATDTKAMQQAASKGDSADATKALNTVLSSDIGRRIEQAHRSDSNHTFSDSRSTALNYQQLLSRADTESTSTQDVLRAGSSLTAAVNQIGAPEYAQQYNTNAAFRRQQLDSGRRRDADPSTKTYRAQAESAMESGSTEAVLQDPGARDAVIRTRAATLQAADPNAPLEDRVGAIKYLTETAGVLTQLGVQGVTPAEVQRHDMNLPDPVDKTGIAGRVSAVPAASEKGPSPSHGLPRSALAIPQVEAATLGVSQGQMKDVQSESDIHAKVEDMHADADESGLGNEGHGTVVRVAANAADNAIDAIRPAGSRSRVKMGNRVPPVAPAQPETASESASETANPILDPRAQGAAMP